jgi:tryptophan-rich sensory protein
MKEKLILFLGRIKPYILPYAIAIALPIAIGLISAAATKDSMDIYEKLTTPPLAPPASVFPIVWSVLFILMGISSAMIYTKRERFPEAARSGLTYYLVSLALNLGWSIVFFNLQASLLALGILVILLYCIYKTICDYRRVYPLAAYMQIPYALWVAFAGYLNAGIWLLN